MKNLYIIIISIALIGTATIVNASPACPDQTYQIGEDNGNPICRLVTGCVNGDSIPKDSPKCQNKPKPISPTKKPLIKKPPLQIKNYQYIGK